MKLFNDLQARHGNKFVKVHDYYVAHRDSVTIENVSSWLPELVSESAEIEEEDSTVRLSSRLRIPESTSSF